MLEDAILCVSKSWIGRVKKILEMFHCSLENMSVDDCIKIMQSNMKREYVINWQKKLGNKESDSGKLYLYRHLKIEFKLEP